MKIVQITGFRGMVTAIFMSICMFAGFVIFPGQVAMFLWNKYLAGPYMLPVLNIFQGVLIWGMIFVSYSILTKKDLAVSFKESKDLTDSEIDMIMQKSRMSPHFRAINNMIKKSDLFETPQQVMRRHLAEELERQMIEQAKDDKKVSNLK
ncbi:hypothetical protein IJ579_02415 [bacterium]|nr:hypothetical protein [bacterium]